MKNQLKNLYNAVSVPKASTRDALAKGLQSVRETLLYCITRWRRIWDMDRRH